jgi:PmbA protein
VSARLDNGAAVDLALDVLRRSGIASGEVFLRDAVSGSVEVKDGEIETVTTRGERGIGIRVIERARPGFAYTSDLTSGGIAACVEAAAAMTRITEPDEHLGIATEPPAVADLAIHEEGMTTRPVAERAEVARRIESAARAHDPRVTGFRKTSYGDAEATTIVATTAGVRAAYRESSFSGSTSVIAAQDGERQTSGHAEASRRWSGLDPEAVGRRAADLAVRKLGARTLATQKMAVLLDPWMGQQLLAAIAPLFSAENVLKGKSLFAGRTGQQVAADGVTIVDDPRREGGMRSAPFDGEGVSTRRRVLVDRGTLAGYLHSLRTASKTGTRPTGNARRGGYGGPAGIAPANLHIAAGSDDPRDLAKRADRALSLTALLNLHTIDPISGEFSLGAAGEVYERGDRAYPVQGITIAGNLTHLLASIAGVGSDLTFGPGGIGSPTLLISELSIGGTST